jgi:hypothetical protein
MPLVDLGLDDDTGDLGDLNGDIALATGDVAIGQYLKQRLRLFLTEWFLAENAGIPFHDEVFVKNPRLLVIDALFKNEILSAPGVVELVRFGMALDGRSRVLTLDFEVRTENGVFLEISEDIGPGVINPFPDGGSGGGVAGKNLLVEFINETTKDINVAVYDFDAQMCDVTVLDVANDYRPAEVDISAPTTSTIRLTSGTSISKVFRVLITPTED